MIFGFVVVFFSGFFSGFMSRDTYLDNKIDANKNDNLITYTGFITNIEFMYPGATVVRFDSRNVLVFDKYNFYIPEHVNVTFNYHKRYNFDIDEPIYVLDNFTINE